VVSISGVRLTTDGRSLVAVPDASARVGTPVRFVLTEGDPGTRRRKRVGEATATVTITANAVRARRAVARGAQIQAGDVAMMDTDLSGRPMRPLLSMASAIGARAIHDIAEDALVTQADILADPLVKAGDIVTAHVHVDGAEVVGRVVAAENGMEGDVIRVVNQGSRAAFRARVIGNGEVEVVNVR